LLNILIPLGAHSPFFEGAEYPYPKPLVEIGGKLMIQHVIENLQQIEEKKRFIFVLREEDCHRFHLDSTVRLLAGPDAVVIRLQHETKGAVCSVMLAVDYITPDAPLLISNGDQLFDVNPGVFIERFRAAKADAGCIYFDSVHPRWSYVRLEGADQIVEAAEKRPISRHAIAGLYYFALGADFMESAKRTILKDASINGQYFIAPVFNELVLANRILKAFPIANNAYHTFYSPQRIEEYESRQNRC